MDPENLFFEYWWVIPFFVAGYIWLALLAAWLGKRWRNPARPMIRRGSDGTEQLYIPPSLAWSHDPEEWELELGHIFRTDDYNLLREWVEYIAKVGFEECENNFSARWSLFPHLQRVNVNGFPPAWKSQHNLEKLVSLFRRQGWAVNAQNGDPARLTEEGIKYFGL